MKSVLGSGIFSDYQCLMKIWTHPWAVKLEAIRRLERENLENIREFLNDSESEPASSEEDGDKHQDKWSSSISESGSHQRIQKQKILSMFSGSAFH